MKSELKQALMMASVMMRSTLTPEDCKVISRCVGNRK